VSEALLAEDADIVDLATGQRQFADHFVARVLDIFERSVVTEQVLAWEAEQRKGPGGRTPTVPYLAVIVAVALAAFSNQPLLHSVFSDILYFQISPTMRSRLGIKEPAIPHTPGPMSSKGLAEKARYQAVRRRFAALVALMDPSPLPKNKRLSDEAFQNAVATRLEQIGHEGLALRYDRLRWFINAVIEESIKLLPRDFRRRWKGSAAVDATAVPAFARPSRPRRGEKWRRDSPPEFHSADPDAGLYRRTPRASDDENAPRLSGITIHAYEATLVVMGPDRPKEDDHVPTLVVAMAPLHKPGHEPGLQAVRALQNLVEDRGHPAAYLAADRAYTDAKPENFAYPVRALGYSVVLDYAEDHLGVMGEMQGFLFIEGAFYSPSIPEALRNATTDLRRGLIDEPTWRARIEERRHYVALRKQGVDADGYGRWMCPALGPKAKVACPLRPASLRHDGRVTVRVEPDRLLRAEPPLCCTQGSVTIGPGAGPVAKLRQELLYGSPEWETTYHGLRSPIEGMNGYLKDGAYSALADPQRRRVRGVGAQSIFVAFLVLAANVRKIDAFRKSMERATSEGPKSRARRRTMSVRDHQMPPSRVTNPPDPPISA